MLYLSWVADSITLEKRHENSSRGGMELFSEWMHWSSESWSSSHQIQLRCTCAFTGGSSCCHRCWTEKSQSEKFCYVLLHFLNGAVKFISAVKGKHEIIQTPLRPNGVDLGFPTCVLWILSLPFEGKAICCNEKLLKIPPNVIDFDWGPVEFLYVSNNRVHKCQRFLWWTIN